MEKLPLLQIKIFIFYTILLINCNPIDYKMKIINNSNSAICFSYSYMYPDTAIRRDDNPNYFANSLVLPGEIESNPIRGTWEEEFKYCDTLMIFIFDEMTLKTVPWDTIRKNYMILKRYDLSLEDLVKMEWRVVYP